MAFTYKTIIPSPIANATIEKVYNNGVFWSYRIRANSGYVLHDSRVDMHRIDKNGMMTDEVIPWFKMNDTTVNKNYDFTDIRSDTYTYTDENGMEITLNVEKIGEYDFYSITQAEYEEIEKAMLAEAMPTEGV